MPPKGDLARQRLLEAVKRDPGIGPAVAARLLGMDPSTASYHVRVLARRGRLIAQRAGGTLALFENGHGACPWMRGALPALR